MVEAIPNNYPRLTSYIVVEDCNKAIQWYTEVFGMKERMRLPAPEGKVGHAELQIGDSLLMLSDIDPMLESSTAKKLGGASNAHCIFVKDVDAVMAHAKKKGATIMQDAEDRFYGDRSGTFRDPWGQVWSPMTHVEDVSPEEMQKRMEQMMAPST